MRAFFLVATIALALAGCAIGPSSRQIAASEMAECQGYGFVVGTPQFAECFERVDQGRIDRASAVRRRFMPRWRPLPIIENPVHF